MQILILLAAFLTSGAIAYWLANRSRNGSDKVSEHPDQHGQILEKDPYECIEPLDDFDWATTTPIKQRPFKSKYHLTMGVENITFSEYIAMDNTYLDRMSLRKDIMDNHLESTVQCNPVGKHAVFEFYSWMFTTYLPKRFPRIYKLSNDSLLNTANNTLIPLSPPSDPIAALRTLGENIDTDFLFLLPKPSPVPSATTQEDKSQPPNPYHLEAFVTCFPSGFSTLSKLGLPLAQIHAPVPGYKAKLEKSMDRFFARLPSGRMVRRSNWTVSTNGQLFCEAGNHLHDNDNSTGGEHEGGAGMEEEIEKQREEVKVEECLLRSERQTLHRLPKTGALVFSFKTYTYSLEEVKLEGSGEGLAEAIEGLGKGSVPEFEFYKRGVVWGEKVVGYLRS